MSEFNLICLGKIRSHSDTQGFIHSCEGEGAPCEGLLNSFWGDCAYPHADTTRATKQRTVKKEAGSLQSVIHHG